MTSQDQPPRPPPSWWPLLLPGAYLLHLGEEWWGGEGFALWMARAYGREVSTTRFLVLNGIYALVSTSRQLPPRIFTHAVLGGILIHGLVAAIAFA